MPRRGYPPIQTWRTFLRNQAFGIGSIGFGEASRLSDKLLAVVRGSRELSGGSPRFRCGLIEPSLTLHRLQPYRSSNRTARRDPCSGCMPVPRPPTSLGRGDNWTSPGRRLSPYRSRASPTRKLPAFTNFARPTARARKRPTIPTARLYCTSATNNPFKKLMIPNALPYPAPLLRVSSHGQGCEEPPPWLTFSDAP